VSEDRETNQERKGPLQDPMRRYILVAAVLVVIIIIGIVLLVTVGLPALRGEGKETATAETPLAATTVPTFTPGPTSEPTNTPPPSPSPTMPALVMSDTEEPAFEFVSAGARPGVEWTGFFGQVLDAGDQPLAGVPVVVWYRDGQPAAPPVQTDADGYYEVRLADAPLAGTWTIQVLTADGQAASKLFTFQTDENTETGIQQIQVIWKRVP
jgi:hypothetical protein